MKVDYIDLYHNPEALFRDVQVRLWPNGSPCIWIQDARGHGVSLTASAGPAGFGLQIHRFVGGNPITVSGNLDDEHLTGHSAGDYHTIELCQYNLDETSQAFKAWYLADASDRAPHPPTLD